MGINDSQGAYGAQGQDAGVSADDPSQMAAADMSSDAVRAALSSQSRPDAVPSINSRPQREVVNKSKSPDPVFTSTSLANSRPTRAIHQRKDLQQAQTAITTTKERSSKSGSSGIKQA